MKVTVEVMVQKKVGKNSRKKRGAAVSNSESNRRDNSSSKLSRNGIVEEIVTVKE